jgi:hypothetical protein
MLKPIITNKYRLFFFLTLPFCLLLVSCATLFNTDFTAIKVASVQDSLKVYIGNDSTNYCLTPARLHVFRSKYPLKLSLEKDGITKNVFIPAKLSATYIYWNFFTLPYGYIFDLANERRYTYPSSVLIDFNSIDNTDMHYKTDNNLQMSENRMDYHYSKKTVLGEKGLFGLHISLPECNSLYIRNKNGYRNYNGFLGITGAAYYYYNENRFAGIASGSVMNFMLPIPASVKYSGEHESASALFHAAYHGNQFKNVSVSYGLSISRNKYHHKFYNWDPDSSYFDIDTTNYSVIENRFGLYFAASYKFTRYFELGLKYMPSFFDLGNKNGNNYTHILFFDLIFNIESRPSERKKN